MDVVVATGPVSMYGKCGNVLDARRMFGKIPEPNEVSWNALIGANVQTEQIKEALQLCGQMQQQGEIPHKFMTVSIPCGCVSQGAVAKGKQSHSFILTCGLEVDIMIRTALVNLYGKYGCLEYAEWVFNTFSERSMAFWTAMIAAYVWNCHGEDAHKSFEQMQQGGFMPERLTLKGILNVFSSISSTYLGKQMHAALCAVSLTQMSLWGRHWSTCMAGGAVWKMHGLSLIECWNGMWSLGTLLLQHIPIMEGVWMLFDSFSKCSRRG